MRRRGFTLIELVLVVAIVSLLIGILLPALHAARDSGHRAVCLANLHSIGQAAAGYLMANGFPAYFDDQITLSGADYSLSWSDFLVKGRYLGSSVNIDAIPGADGSGWPGVYLAGMVSQRDPVFQCPAQTQRIWGDVNGIGVSFRADYLATGHENGLPIGGIYRDKRLYADAQLIWLGEAFTTLGGISAREYVRETQLHLDSNEVNPLRHLSRSTFLFGDGHADWFDAYTGVDWSDLHFPWEGPP